MMAAPDVFRAKLGDCPLIAILRGVTPDEVVGIGDALVEAGLQRMEAAERGEDDTLESDIAFHIAVLEASANPFFLQFRDIVATALRTSIRFTNRFKGRTADVAAHRAVYTAIQARDPAAARAAMTDIIGEVMDFITTAKPA